MIGQKIVPSILIDGVLNDTLIDANISIDGEQVTFTLWAALIPEDLKRKIVDNSLIGKETILIEEVKNSVTGEIFNQETIIKIKEISIEYNLDKYQEPTQYLIRIVGVQ